MLPYSDRVVSVVRGKYLPCSNRGIPVPKEPATIGGHLRKRRLKLKLLQSQAAHKLNVSTVTLSRWECDKLHPVWSRWPAIVAYLGYDPFTNPALGRPKGNESYDVAILSSEPHAGIGQQIVKRRLELKKNRSQCAQELGVCVKTLWGWETGRHKISNALRKKLMAFLG